MVDLDSQRFPSYSLDIPIDVCAICRNQLMDDCIECQGNPDSVLAQSCKVAFGECNHAYVFDHSNFLFYLFPSYHFHCIHKWLEKANGNNACPMDGLDWEYARFSDKNTIPK
jgi:RING-box protein 1